MNLFKLYASLTIDTGEYEKAVKGAKTDAGKLKESLDGVKSSAGSLGTKLKTGLVASFKAVSVAAAAASAAVGVLVKSSIDGYAEYEQLVGGVETLFKESSDAVTAYAEQAYKRQGLTANQYMETVTSFSASLLQSLDGDTKAAAEVADTAITDMADNANKMGTSMEMIQNAYQGFAKANYTMLDNLKLGYGGTKEEMERLLADAEAISGIEYDLSSYADVVEAIHVIQTEMGITGTTAKEAASTISGSVATAKAAWSNLVTGMSNENADLMALSTQFADSVAVAAGNILPRIEQALSGIGTVITALAPVVVEALPGMVEAVLPGVISAAGSLVNSLMAALPGLMGAFRDILPTIMDGVVSMVSMMDTTNLLGAIVREGMNLIESAVLALVNALPEMLTVFIDQFLSMITSFSAYLPSILEAVSALMVSIAAALPEIVQGIVDYLPEVIDTICYGLLVCTPQFIEAGLQLVEAIVAALPDIIAALIDEIPNIIKWIVAELPGIIAAIVAGVLGLVPELVTAGGQLLLGLLEGMVMLIGSIPAVLRSIFDGIVNGIKELFGIHSPSTVMADIGTNIMQGLIDGINSLLEALRAIWDGIYTTVTETWNTISTKTTEIWDGIKSSVGQTWDDLKASASEIWTNITGAISDAWNTVSETTSEIWNSVTNSLSGFWDDLSEGATEKWTAMTETIGSAWDTISGKATEIWDGITSTVTGKWAELSGSAATTWEAIKGSIGGAIEGARDLVSGAIDKIKGFFNFEFTWPKLKLPHFSFTGSWNPFDWPDKFPSIGVKWYAKAMNNPMLLTRPTIFGQDDSGKYLAGGEAGPEVVAGANTLMNMIRGAVASGSGAAMEQVIALLSALLEAVTGGNAEMIDALTARQTIAFDKREFGRLVKQYV